jgi:hypothetical protein
VKIEASDLRTGEWVINPSSGHIGQVTERRVQEGETYVWYRNPLDPYSYLAKLANLRRATILEINLARGVVKPASSSKN